jgi:hypothetical protein
MDQQAAYMRKGLSFTKFTTRIQLHFALESIFLSKKAADAAKQAAEAAKVSADISASQFSLHNRADVRLERVDLDFPGPGVEIREIMQGTYLIVEFRNYGNIRAEQVSIEVVTAMSDSRSFPWKSGFSKVLAPDEIGSVRCPISAYVTYEDYASLFLSKLTITVDVTVSYSDELRPRTPVTFHGVYIRGQGIQER